jgi:hypothetical protein
MGRLPRKAWPEFLSLLPTRKTCTDQDLHRSKLVLALSSPDEQGLSVWILLSVFSMGRCGGFPGLSVVLAKIRWVNGEDELTHRMS